MAKSKMDDMLKKRMAATQQASELQASDEAYQQIFREKVPAGTAELRDLPLDKLIPFHTADIGFRPYPQSKLEALSEQLREDGLFVRIIVRPVSAGKYEILSGHNRVAAAKLAGWDKIPSEVVEADDARAVVIATSTNLIQRQGLSIVERGKAYKALLEAKNRKGQRFDLMENATSGDNRPRYSARALVAEFFGVTEYEIRKAIKLTQLIPELTDILENNPKQLNLACADLMADYDAESQRAFVEMCSIEDYQLNKAAMQYIVCKCPPPSVERQAIFAAWRESRAAAEKKLAAPSKKISFDRRRFAPYLAQFNSDQEIEELFLEFLQERAEVS